MYPKTATGQKLSGFLTNKILEGILSFRDVISGLHLLIISKFFASSGVDITLHEADSVHKFQFILSEEFLGGSV